MVHIILASHGEMAKGLTMTLEMIIGKQESFDVITLMPNMAPEEVYTQAKGLCNSEDDVLFFVDVWGGTPCNQISKLIEENSNYRMITGMNLPMVLEACMARNHMETSQDVMEYVLSIESIQSLPASKKAKIENEKNIQTKIEKGYMDFVLARIDSRLLHGQVATGWCKTYNPDRILVVSDAVSHDDVRKKMIIQAAPAGIKAHVIPLKKLVELAQDDRFGNMKVLLLFENVQDALKIVESGVQLPSINLGSIAHSEGKVVVNPAISMDLKDVDALAQLIQHHVEIDVRKVPSDGKENIETLLSKAKSMLKEER